MEKTYFEAKLTLRNIYMREKMNFFEYAKYTYDLKSMDFETPKTIEEGGCSKYTYEIIEASEHTFVAKATAILYGDSDWTINQELKLVEITKE